MKERRASPLVTSPTGEIILMITARVFKERVVLIKKMQTNHFLRFFTVIECD